MTYSPPKYSPKEWNNCTLDGRRCSKNKISVITRGAGISLRGLPLPSQRQLCETGTIVLQNGKRESLKFKVRHTRPLGKCRDPVSKVVDRQHISMVRKDAPSYFYSYRDELPQTWQLKTTPIDDCTRQASDKSPTGLKPGARRAVFPPEPPEYPCLSPSPRGRRTPRPGGSF